MEINKWIVDWFEKNTSSKKEDLLVSFESNYFEKGWIDSFKFVSFIMDIENNFNISFSNNEFQDRKFSTIQGLTEIISNRIENQK